MVGIADLLTAVLAAEHRTTVVHYDAGFEITAEMVELERRWVLPKGTLSGAFDRCTQLVSEGVPKGRHATYAHVSTTPAELGKGGDWYRVPSGAQPRLCEPRGRRPCSAPRELRCGARADRGL